MAEKHTLLGRYPCDYHTFLRELLLPETMQHCAQPADECLMFTQLKLFCMLLPSFLD